MVVYWGGWIIVTYNLDRNLLCVVCLNLVYFRNAQTPPSRQQRNYITLLLDLNFGSIEGDRV